jgi:hypothetical protein
MLEEMPIPHVRRGAKTRYCPFTMRVLTLSAALLVAAFLAGCGSRNAPNAAAAAPHPAGPPKKAVAPVDNVSRNMVSAVSATKAAAGLQVQLKFELRERPAVAQPVDIDVVILPATNLDRVYGRVEGEDGLKLIEGAQIPATDRPTEGVPINHTIKVVPQRDGIYTLRAVVTTELGTQSSNQTFSIPLIAGSGLPDVPNKVGGPTPTANRTAAAPPTPPAKR